ncbi:hypothetical protein [Rhizobium sp. SL86]|uniref:hypothetical protein n=1 Tax=Rhizobium sp. SL86 TaxID=2995148 RepID=UPI0022733A1C|nr:hypothetical protein [Rhizobium sp. SL86]MCY1664597.1 hypothetical protein [Rhizobium sp. SL86]
MSRITVKLTRRYEAPGYEPFDEIELREPSYVDLFMAGLGRPFEFHSTASGTIVVRHPEVIDQYAQRLVVKPDYRAIMQISAVDAGRLENAINGFLWRGSRKRRSPLARLQVRIRRRKRPANDGFRDRPLGRRMRGGF